jgi:phospholipase/lecithinase/hemolysin
MRILIAGLIYIFASIGMANPSQIIYFGDSLSDIGNHKVAPLTNLNLEGHKYLWPQYLAKIITGNGKVWPISQAGVNLESDNVSYAYVGANTGDYYFNVFWPTLKDNMLTMVPQCQQPGLLVENNEPIAFCLPGLLKQVALYLDAVKGHPNPQALFFIWAGANDLKYIFKDLTLLLESSTQIQAIIANIMTAKDLLILNGVPQENIFIISMPDLRLLPIVPPTPAEGRVTDPLLDIANLGTSLLEKTLGISVDNKLKEIGGFLSDDFNNQLSTQITQGPLGLSPAQFIDINPLTYQVLEHPASYGFTIMNQACNLNSQDPFCKGFMYYDIKHPTSLAHEYMADYIAKIYEKSRLTIKNDE